MPVPFGRHLPRGDPGRPGRDDQRPARTRKHMTERLHRPPIRICRALEVACEGDVVLERQVDHAVAGGRRAPQHAGIVEGAGLHLGSGRGERGGGGLRAGQAVIDANPELRERELIKLATLASAIAGALRERGVSDPAASLTAEAGIAVFKIAFMQWIHQAGPAGLPQIIRESLEELKAVTAGR